jgi:hypothetical protein
MYWRLTSKEKPIKTGRIKVIAAWQGEKIEENEHALCVYYADENIWRVKEFYSGHEYKEKDPHCWSYIDELPCEEIPDEPNEE